MTSGILAVVGDLVEDVIVWHRRPVHYATDNTAAVFRTRGGSAANVGAAAAALCPVRFIGRVGDDVLADSLTAQLEDAGIDVRVQREGRTGTIVILVDETGERTMFPDRGAAAKLGPIDEEVLDGVAWLHVPFYGFTTPVSSAAIRELARVAASRGIAVSVDLSSLAVLRETGTETVRTLLADLRPDVVFANTEEAECVGLLERPIGLSIVKAGPNPVTIVSDEGMRQVSVRPVDTVADATGAGDAFAAGYIARALDGGGPEECALAGSERAAIALRTPGAV
ncbi:carbohydrate kinase family protein [Microbacterium sp. ASV49]|uniref:PfkB family carbohydrate kinase n=1 Tax=Microbacterium candidum TaxID=3041922 RepID=A0ABT7N352_9MICO|nr:PfkB family carbohydrate kinase [Microbacterium sp. ASV49]MDL9981143.1 PfkB family carbohydrate kinase [Microbacterium sp. ASV49]